MMMPLDSDGQNDLGHTALAGGPDVHQPVRMAGRHDPMNQPGKLLSSGSGAQITEGLRPRTGRRESGVSRDSSRATVEKDSVLEERDLPPMIKRKKAGR